MPHRSNAGARVLPPILVAALLAVLASPAQASMNQLRMFERDGQTIIVSQDVGNQAFPYQWVENDARRHSADGLTLYYRIDLTELPPGITVAETEAAIEAAVATFNGERCARNLELVRVDSDPGADLGWVQRQVLGGDAGSDQPRADITFAGWVGDEFWPAIGFPDAMGLAVPVLPSTDGTSLIWGLDAFDPDQPATDINSDRKRDLFATEIYFRRNANYVVDDDDLGNTLFYIDLESIVLHELGHALGMDHFGRTSVILDENGELVDVVINENSGNVMNTSNFFVRRSLSGSDRASFCGLYGNWGGTMSATAFVDVTVIATDPPAALADHVVVVDGDRITAVGPSNTMTGAIPAGAEVIDGAGRHLAPGLADMHVHLGFSDPDPGHLILYLAEGTTLVRALSGSPLNPRWREQVAAGELVGPTILTSGPTIIGGIEGSPEELAALPIVQPSTVTEIVEEVRAQAAGWADLIKVYDGLDPAVYLAAIREAGEQGMYVTGHLLDGLALEDIVAAGLDEVAHLDELNFRHWHGVPGDPDFALDWEAIPETARLLADGDVAVVSNLSATEIMAELLTDTDSVLARNEYRVVRPHVLEAWRHGRQTGAFAGQGPYRRDLELPFFRALLAGLRDVGVTVLVGTDTSPLMEGSVPSKIHRELELLVECGFSSADALLAATAEAADVVARMGGNGAFGRVAPGHRADLLLLDGNPLDDIGNLRDRAGVMVRGTFHRQPDLDQQVDEFVATFTAGVAQ